MKLEVTKRRLTARTAATLSTVDPEEVQDAAQRLRSWALTKGLTIQGALSWVLPSEAGGSFEVRCPLTTTPDIHPDVGIGLHAIPAAYVAEVELLKPEHAVAPEEVAAALRAWAHDNGFEPAGAAEVFKVGIDRREFRLALPIKRRASTDSIEL